MKKLLGAILLATLAGISVATAQSYPSRPVTLIVPFPAGGATDVLARFLAERMRQSLGQPIVIENVTGAAGTIGVGRAVRAPADGYTVQIGTSTTNVMTGALYSLQFDLMTDLDPIIQIASEPMMIVGKKDFPAGNLKELIAWLKANPGQGVGRHSRRRRHRASHRARIPEGDRNDVPVRAVSRQRARAAGPRRRPDRPADGAGVELLRAGEGRRDQAVCDDVEDAHRRGARHPDRGGGRPSRICRLALVRRLGAEGHAEGGVRRGSTR